MHQPDQDHKEEEQEKYFYLLNDKMNFFPTQITVIKFFDDNSHHVYVQLFSYVSSVLFLEFSWS